MNQLKFEQMMRKWPYTGNMGISAANTPDQEDPSDFGSNLAARSGKMDFDYTLDMPQ